MNRALDYEYRKHEIFSFLAIITEYYKLLSFSIMSFISSGVPGMVNLDSRIVSSIQGTLESIKLILKKGRINDAYALTRKYHDIVIINTYEILYLEKHYSIDNFIVEKINNWLIGKESLPRFENMIKFIDSSSELKAVNELLDSDYYKTIRARCNDHTHYNYFQYMMMNDNEILFDRISILDELTSDLKAIFIKHFIWLFTLKQHYMSSSDYLDCLECGITPEEGSQYYVAPFI